MTSGGYRSVHVYVRDSLAGILRETDTGYCFQYLPEYLADADQPPVSLTLPRQEEPYESKILFPFFDGLIPEGWMLDMVIRNWKLDRHDRFGILKAACRDCVGAVSIREAES